MANNKCKECSCVCNKCALNQDVHLHVEIENLKQRLVERDNHIVTMETTFLNEANKYPNGEFVALREELLTWQDKYSRLYEAHKRVQKVNQSLEDKLLKLVDKTETEKTALTKDVATLSHRLADANYTIQRLQEDNEKYKNDVNLAIQLLQCKPGNFVSHRIDSLPNEVQAKVSSYIASRRKPPEERKPSEVRSIKVPIPTFPPTAMVYSIPKTPSPEKDPNKSTDMEKPQVDLVSAAIMAKILEEREKERSLTKHCDTCTCSKHTVPPVIIHAITHHTVATQTGNQKTSLCLKCNAEVERSPLGSMKIIKTAPAAVVAVDGVPNNNKLNVTTTKTYPQNALLYSEVNEKTPSSKLNNNHHIINNNNNTNTNNNTNSKCSKVAVSENSKISVKSFTDSFVKTTTPKTTIDPKSGHHRLCEQNVGAALSTSNSQLQLDETDSKKKNTNTTTSSSCVGDNVKGPRYCSMRLQTGSKNILLDNVHGTYAPVLYTRQESNEKKQQKEAGKLPNKENSETSKTISVHLQHNNSRADSTSTAASDDRKSLSLSECDNSYQKQQRVAEWVQNIDENETTSASASGSENSKNDNHSKRILTDFEAQQQYAQIETNVKNFLFKSELLNNSNSDGGSSDAKSMKKFSNLKQKYQSLPLAANDGCSLIDMNKNGTKNVPTETEI